MLVASVIKSNFYGGEWNFDLAKCCGTFNINKCAITFPLDFNIGQGICFVQSGAYSECSITIIYDRNIIGYITVDCNIPTIDAQVLAKDRRISV